MASNNYFPVQGSTAYKILCSVRSQPEPVSKDWLERTLIIKDAALSKTVTLLVVGGWLLPVGEDPVCYRITDQATEFMNEGRKPWDDDEHRAWMRQQRERYAARITRDSI